MDKTIVINLPGQATGFRLEEAAYQELTTYLDRAGARLHDDPDRSEVLRDLETSIGERLATALGSTPDRLVTAADVGRVLEEIGSVDTGREPVAEAAGSQPRRRRLRRIRDGQQVAGVCTGLAAYSEIDVDWIRTIFVLGTLVTAGILGLVYIAMAFILPIEDARTSRSS